jgi:GntR family transcriptional regulator, transcriptional repressor for pyruvate dehydrogenase complex
VPGRASHALPTSALGATRRSAKLTDSIIEALRQDIVTGRLAQGDRLPNERELAAHFGVSQPTIREAVRALDAMGLVDVRHGSGAYIRGDGSYILATALQTMLQIESVTIIQVLDVREILGRESVRVAATMAAEEDLAGLEQHIALLAAVDEVGTVDEVVDAIVAFQVALSAAAHNPLMLALEGFLVNLLLQLQTEVLRHRGVAFWRARSLGFQPDRVAIVAGLRAHDDRNAANAMEAYLEHQRGVFLQDSSFSEMRLSDERAMKTVADIVTAVRVA